MRSYRIGDTTDIRLSQMSKELQMSQSDIIECLVTVMYHSEYQKKKPNTSYFNRTWETFHYELEWQREEEKIRANKQQ